MSRAQLLAAEEKTARSGETIRRLELTIHGHMPSKNDQRAVRIGGRAGIVKGDRSKAWEVQAWIQLRPQLRALGFREPIRGPVRISGTVYYKTKASDLDLSRLKDALQGPPIHRGKRGAVRKFQGLVYYDDNQVAEYGGWRKETDATNPRVEFVVEEIPR